MPVPLLQARTAQRRRLVMCVQAFRPIKTALLQVRCRVNALFVAVGAG